jgi:hypothetical protein
MPIRGDQLGDTSGPDQRVTGCPAHQNVYAAAGEDATIERS